MTDYDCYRCGRPGHTRANCPQETSFPPGAPASGDAALGLLADICPLCGVLPGKTCVNIAPGKPMYKQDGTPVTHPARHEAVWHDPHLAARRAQIRSGEVTYTGRRPSEPKPELREQAAAQVAEARAARTVSS